MPDDKKLPQLDDEPRRRRREREADEFAQYGEETDIPARRRKKKPAAKKSKPVKKRTPEKKASASPFQKYTRKRKRREQQSFKLFGREVKLSFWRIFGIAAALIIISFAFLQSNNIAIDAQKLTVVGLPTDFEEYKVLVLSDLNGKRFGENQSTLLRTINTLSYNIVIMTGDMVGKGGDPQPFYELLEGLPSRRKVYFVAGDNDPGPYRKVPRDITGTVEEMIYEDWILGAIERGAVFVDKPIEIEVGDSKLWLTPASLLNMESVETANDFKSQVAQEEKGVISGLKEDRNSLPATTYRYKNAQQFMYAANNMKESELHISISHVPPTLDFIEAAVLRDMSSGKYLTQPELILAGHYCGGVVRLPFIGAFYISDSTAEWHGWLPKRSSVSGLSTVRETQMYISSGLSTNGDVPLMPFRFLNQPQVSVLTLTATLPESMLDK